MFEFFCFLFGMGCGLVMGYYAMMVGVKKLVKNGELKLGDS